METVIPGMPGYLKKEVIMILEYKKIENYLEVER
jgi:hypothetical protein